ncbi:AraC family L-rhamnose operon regulatory protein RhaS [Kineococcus radiotolerans]|uniref:AraC family L-rhamnose operon regulatory protein RhaS n=1 Tax=Kineococcus radiotolerans TaxID=131568 RepID=A0A7W4XVG2_KINRA|nr:AraC family transcriptional regulator [Kineococcus radiotolerans]MBB2899297.1 AraC family L-rhamnose operon regulatory protein RhaS [Kineococcus radiotolerans]
MAGREAAMFRGSDGTYRDDPSAPLRRAGARGDIGLWAWGRNAYPGALLEDGVLPGVLNAGLWEVTADQDWGLDWHLNEGVEVTFVTHGRAGFSTETTQRDLQRGWISVTRPWQRHRIGLPTVTACTLGWFILDVGALLPNQTWRWPGWLPLPPGDLDRLAALLRGSDRSVWPASTGMVHAAERMERTMREQTRRTTAHLGLRISEVLLELIDVLEGEEPELDPHFASAERSVAVFLKSLPSHLSEAWTVDAMAKHCGLGRTRFIYHCRQAVNATPMDYLTGLRVDRALDLLTGTDLTISEIALSCGFSSSQYFATVFRQHCNRSPRDARRARDLTSVTTTAQPPGSTAGSAGGAGGLA